MLHTEILELLKDLYLDPEFLPMITNLKEAISPHEQYLTSLTATGMLVLMLVAL